MRIDVINKSYLLNSFGISDTGMVREQNEDAWATYPEQGLFLLADGMGGHSAGEVAAKEAIDHFAMLYQSWSLAKRITPSAAKAFFEQAIAKVNLRIYQEGQQDEDLKGMGTTLCVLYLHNEISLVAHVGDSRIYRMRSLKLEPLTEDHSLVNEMVAIGAMKGEASDLFPYKHILTRAIGTHPQVEPTINTIDVEPGDLFMLCSDGLSNYVSDEQIATVLRQRETLADKGEVLVAYANEQGGADNVSVVLVEVSRADGDLSR